VLSRAVLALMIALVIAVLIVLATGGWRLNLGPVRISMSNLRNPFAGLWLLAIVWTALRVRFSVTRQPDAMQLGRHAPATPAGLAILAILAIFVLPLAIPAIGLLLSGDYVSPPRVWRSGPRGIDLLTLVAGNPMNPVYGHATRAAYARAGIDLMEQTAWIGLVPLVVLGALVAAPKARDALARPWWSIALVFLIWATGGYLLVGGVDTGLPMPQVLARFVPILSNARIPGRAIVMVQLAAAMLSACAVTRLRWTPSAILFLIGLSVVDGSAAPIRLYEVPKPGGIESALARDSREGAIVELPAGVRDGFSEAGRFDHRALVFQMAHEKPLAGGFVARLSPRLRLALQNMTELSALQKLSSAELDDDLPPDLGRGLLDAGFTHVVVNTDRMPADTRGALEARGLRLVMVEGTRALYLVGTR
jgi:hypothetical protein